MESFQTFILLMFAAAILVGIAQKILVPYPLALVLGGIAIGFIPALQPISLDPNLILFIVLPPLLYYAAFGISFKEFKHNYREIISLALGLVIFTTFVIGLIFKWIFPEYPWALAFTFGAIISPPDAIAATTILKRFSINPRLTAILEGESLVNDASALVLYKLTVAAVLSGIFSFSDASVDFVKMVSGGIVVGLILGYVLQNFSRRFLEPTVGAVFSFTIPYTTYVIANLLDVSGVLAVVVNGLFGSRLVIKHHSPLRRILGFASWDIFVILMNCYVFVLIGLQLRILSGKMSLEQMMQYSWYAVIFTFAMIAIRMIWVYTKNMLHHLQIIKIPKSHILSHREAAIVAWAGMRGIVSMVAALALPLTLSNGMPFEGRNEVIFITFAVILLTLLIPGFTLPLLIKWLKIPIQPEHIQIHKVRKSLMEVSLTTINNLHATDRLNDTEFKFFQDYLHLQDKLLSSHGHQRAKNFEITKNIIIQEKRKKLFELWENLEINDKNLTQLEQELDLEETPMARADIK
jgi:CPA1 family monovalent cation:H+ antiporter